MKKKKNMFWATMFCLIVISWILPTTTAISPEMTLEYQDYDAITLPGDVTLSYVVSETGRNDLNIEFSTYVYNETNNITGSIYIVTSEEIPVDWHFENNTKSYIYKDQNNNLYCFEVDYSNIIIPVDPEFKETKANLSLKIMRIAQLDQEIIGLEENLTSLKNEIDDEKDAYDVICDKFKDLNNTYEQLEHNYIAQKDVNILLINQSMEAQGNYGIQLSENKILRTRIKKLEEEKKSPLNYVFYPVMVFIGFVGFWQYNDYKNGKGLFSSQKKSIEKHHTQHSDSGILNQEMKQKAQEIKKEKEKTKDSSEVTKAKIWDEVSNDIDDIISKKIDYKKDFEIV